MVSEELDRGFLAALRDLVGRAGAAHQQFDYATGLAHTEAFFWDNFTDSYIELAKNRAKGEGGVSEQERASAVATLDFALSVLIRMFAPVLPYITEELWSWDYARRVQNAGSVNGARSVEDALNGADTEAGAELPAACSVHRAPWPAEAEFAAFRRPTAMPASPPPSPPWPPSTATRRSPACRWRVPSAPCSSPATPPPSGPWNR